jgi:hypothetical protein
MPKLEQIGREAKFRYKHLHVDRCLITITHRINATL